MTEVATWNGLLKVVLLVELKLLKQRTLCVCNKNNRLGILWTKDFASGSEFRLLLQDVEEFGSCGMNVIADKRIETFS